MSETEYQITQKQAAEYLNVSTKTISRYRQKGLPFKMILNPVTGKQEVRFRQEDLQRWHDGRELLANYAQDKQAQRVGSDTDLPRQQKTAQKAMAQPSVNNDYLAELLVLYKDQIETLKDQLADMRRQLSRRDRQIDDLMRLMVGLQLEYKPLKDSEFEPEEELAQEVLPVEDEPKKVFSEEELSSSILRLRQRGKSYADIARGLNQINVATLSGNLRWTEAEVQSLLPAIIDNEPNVIEL